MASIIASAHTDSMASLRFSGQRVIVTGAGRGIGRAIAVQLSRSGVKVIAVSRTASHLEQLKTEVPDIETIACDLEDLDALKTAITPFLPVHYLVNNAGTNIPEPFLDVSVETFDKLFCVNFKSAFFLTQWVVRAMIEHKIKGAIVNISSQASNIPLPAHSVYSATKAALDNMTKSLTYEMGAHGIRVNAVNPTVVMTELGKRDWSDPAKATPMLNRIPLHTFAEVEDVVDVVLMLLSDGARMVNGVCLPVDGGAAAC